MGTVHGLAVVTALGVAVLFVVAWLSARAGHELRPGLVTHLQELLLPSSERRIRRAGRRAVAELDDVLAAAAISRLQQQLQRGPVPAEASVADGLFGPRLRLVGDGFAVDVRLFRSEDVAGAAPGSVQLFELWFEEPIGWRVGLRGPRGTLTCHAWRVQASHRLSV